MKRSKITILGIGMPNPRTAAEWAAECYQKSHRSYADAETMCVKCADAYARQQVEAFRERAAQKMPTRDLAAAIRALEP